MKVKLQYTVELDNIPREISKIMPDQKEVSYVLGQLSEIRSLSYSKPLSALESIEDTRRALFDIDQRLEDIHAILSGYIKYKVEDNKTQQEETKENLEETLQKSLEELARYESMTNIGEIND